MVYLTAFTDSHTCRMVPNAEHSLTGHFTSLILDVRAFCLSILLVSEWAAGCWTVSQVWLSTDTLEY